MRVNGHTACLKCLRSGMDVCDTKTVVPPRQYRIFWRLRGIVSNVFDNEPSLLKISWFSTIITCIGKQCLHIRDSRPSYAAAHYCTFPSLKLLYCVSKHTFSLASSFFRIASFCRVFEVCGTVFRFNRYRWVIRKRPSNQVGKLVNVTRLTESISGSWIVLVATVSLGSAFGNASLQFQWACVFRFSVTLRNARESIA